MSLISGILSGPSSSRGKTIYVLLSIIQILLETGMTVACVAGFLLFLQVPRPIEPAMALDVVLLILCVLGPLTINAFSMVLQ